MFGCTLSTATTNRLARPWPTKFTFPVYALRAGVIQKLESGEQLSRGDRSQVTDSVYHEVTKYTYYPKEWQYTEVVTMFLERFPKQKTSDNLAMNLWRQRIQYRFQNDRRRKDANSMPGKRRISDPNAEGPPPKKRSILMWGLKNYLSQRPEGEDDLSIKRHKAEMKLQLSKRTPDRCRLDRFMDLTFADRREFIVKENPLVKDIEDEYPVLLSSGNEVLKEFKRISAEGLPNKLKSGIGKYHDKLFTLAKKQENALVKKLVELASQEIIDENREGKAYCASIAVVPVLLKEKLDHLLTEQDNSQMNLYIHHAEDLYKVMLEGENVFETKHLLSSFEVYFACFYVFNISYPKSLKKTLQFFQRPILNIQDKEKVHPSVCALLDKLSH